MCRKRNLLRHKKWKAPCTYQNIYFGLHVSPALKWWNIGALIPLIFHKHHWTRAECVVLISTINTLLHFDVIGASGLIHGSILLGGQRWYERGVIRDCSPEGRHIYVIQAYSDGVHIAGNYEEGNEYAAFELFRNKSSIAWEFLVSNMAAMTPWYARIHRLF